jgi:hypothetical protein
MEDIKVNHPFIAVFAVNESLLSDEMWYTIRKGSNGEVIQSGLPVFIGGISWKVTFTPTVVGEIYIVSVTDARLDITVTNVYRGKAKVEVAA